ncbi:fumarylacetoacetate hydrolase family protein [Ferviditalea candida]|uniref:Fumarylacetoacetate hydrolase family protein n=1 Tax=Ferviditalea candida TaxID=3108399 RepID=A0ABU5ZN17_9BACL|nr:fumarylacetoacetate hydrolase family protein [Paenibacillaceae bacterium T2]
MKVLRYYNDRNEPVLAALTEKNRVLNLPQNDFMQLVHEADAEGLSAKQWIEKHMNELEELGNPAESLSLAVPITAPEVWAAGVTYERSRVARNYESTNGRMNTATFYDKVYDAERPELFIKSTAARTVGPNEDLYLRSDSAWQIPEPELGLVIDGRGRILGYTIGNDMSSRDIEGENPLYLPQAKVWKRSCSIGPVILLADAVEDPYKFEIRCEIYRNDVKVVDGSATTGQLKRKLDELVSYLIRDNEIFEGTVLLTGTCIVPPNEFTLEDGDRVEISISGIGLLVNPIRSQNHKN